MVLENLAVPRENIKEIAEKSLKAVALLEYKDRLTYQLSGGEKQRLAIASVLAMGTEIFNFLMKPLLCLTLLVKKKF